MIDLQSKYLDEVKAILDRFVPHCEVRVFGSRVKGNVKPFSDLDLAIVGKTALDFQTVARLKEAFSDSDLPIIVDIVDFHKISDNFKKIIETQYEVIQKNTKTEA